MNETLIIDLLRQYYTNQDRIKQIRKWRAAFINKKTITCDFSCMVVEDDSATCPMCRRRMAYHRDIVALSKVNSGITRKIKNIIKKHDQSPPAPYRPVSQK